MTTLKNKITILHTAERDVAKKIELKRIMDAMTALEKYQCSECDGYGHNRRNCVFRQKLYSAVGGT